MDASREQSTPTAFLTSLTPSERCQEEQRLKCLSQRNVDNLSLLRDALFVVALDPDTSPRKANEAMFELHSGNFVNRWYDKSVQLVVFGNGVAGLLNNYLAGMTGTVGTNFVRIAVKNERLAGEETEDGGLRCDINFTETCSAPLKFSTESFCHITFVFISVLRNRQTSCRSFIYTWKNKGYYL